MESEYEKINKGHVKIYLSQVGVKNFRFTIQSYVVVGCKLFLFRYQVVLLLKRTGWKGLTRHPKHRGKDNSIRGQILSNLERMMQASLQADQS
jgi:hypothetical protein